MGILGKIKKSKTIKAGLGYTIGNYLIKGISFLALPLFSRLMSVEEFGAYNVYIGYTEILTILIGLALHSSLKNAKYKYQEKLNSYLSCIVLLPVVLMLVFISFGNLLFDWLSPVLNMNRITLNILVIHSFASAVFILYNAKLSLDYRYKSYLVLSTINCLGDLLLSVILMFTILNSDHYLARVIGTALPLVLLSVYILITFFISAKPTFNKEYYWFSLKYSIPVIPHGLSQVVLASSDKIMIENYLGKTEAGLYSFGSNVAGIVRVTTLSLDNVYGPWFYDQINQENYSKVKKFSSIYIIMMCAFISLIILLVPEIVFIAGGDKYSSSVYAVIPSVTSMFFTFLYTLPSTVEYFYGKTWIIAASSVFSAILNIILNLIFIPRYGYIAAVYTTLVSYIIYFLIHYLAAYILTRKWFFSNIAVLASALVILCVNFLTVWLAEQLIPRLVLASVVVILMILFVIHFVKMRRGNNA